MNPSEAESQRLGSFRRVAREVRDASIIADGQKITLHFAPAPPEHVAVYVSLLGREPFRSLALAVRLAYQQGEVANFYSICNILRRHGNADIAPRVDRLRAEFGDALSDSSNAVTVDSDGGPAVFSATDVFEHWLYGVAFHQDPHRQPAVTLLRTDETRFLWSVQATALQLAGKILDLDDVIAEFLGQTRLERI